MNNILYITLQGKPLGKQRARKGPHGWYNPQEKEMQIAKNIIKKQLPENFEAIPSNIPVIVNTTFFFEPTKQQRNKKFIELIKNENYPYCKKPDVDNLKKFTLDSMSKIVFYDDNQVYGCEKMFKFYTLNNPRTEIEVKF